MWHNSLSTSTRINITTLRIVNISGKASILDKWWMKYGQEIYLEVFVWSKCRYLFKYKNKEIRNIGTNSLVCIVENSNNLSLKWRTAESVNVIYINKPYLVKLTTAFLIQSNLCSPCRQSIMINKYITIFFQYISGVEKIDLSFFF